MTPTQILNTIKDNSLFKAIQNKTTRTITIMPKGFNTNRIAGIDMPFLMSLAEGKVWYVQAYNERHIQFVIEY